MEYNGTISQGIQIPNIDKKRQECINILGNDKF